MDRDELRHYIQTVELGEQYEVLLEKFLNNKLIYPEETEFLSNDDLILLKETETFINIILVEMNKMLCEIERMQAIIKEKQIIFVREK